MLETITDATRSDTTATDRATVDTTGSDTTATDRTTVDTTGSEVADVQL
jgi:hypothetical protein